MRPFWWKSGSGFLAYSRKRLLLLSGDIAMGIWARKYRYCSTGLCKGEQSCQVTDKAAVTSTSSGSHLRSTQLLSQGSDARCLSRAKGHVGKLAALQGSQGARETNRVEIWMILDLS